MSQLLAFGFSIVLGVLAAGACMLAAYGFAAVFEKFERNL